MINDDLLSIRIIKIFLLSILSALIPFIILSYMWGGYSNVPQRVTITIFIVNTIPCIIINLLYHRYYYLKEMLSSFYFYITFFLTFLIIMIHGIRLLKGNYFDYIEGYITLFMLAESMAVFIYITYIFIKYIRYKYDFSIIEKLVYLITGVIFANFVILFTSSTSALVIYVFD